MKTLKESVHTGWLRAVESASRMQIIRVPKVQIKAKAELKRRGWSYRSAASEMGCAYQHLSEVLNGKRPSRAILSKIAALPERRAA